jgi:hypothetical protein
MQFEDGLILDTICPVFVVGPPRSGTTLVQLLISAHPTFFSAPETHYFTYVLEPFDDWINKKLTLEQLGIIFTRLATKPMLRFNEEFQADIRQKYHNGISASVLLNELMMYFSSDAKSTRWVEKTPKHALYVSNILKIFPNAKVIAVIRDPRDVASSQSPFGEFSSQIQLRKYRLERAELWKRIVCSIAQLAPDDRIMIIRYEDIIEKPVSSLRSIMNFIGENFHPQALSTFSSNYDQVVLSEEDQHKQLASVDKIVDRRGIWKTRISSQEALLIEVICGSVMNKYGYLPHLTLGPLEYGKNLMLVLEKYRINFVLKWQGFVKRVKSKFFARNQ